MIWDVKEPLMLMPAVQVALATACGDPSNPWALPVLATSGERGGTCRVLVLREIDSTASRLIHYSDLRSAKFDDIRRDPRGCWCFYQPQERIMLRAFGKIEIISAGTQADQAWARLTEYGRRHYFDPRPPGTIIHSLHDAVPPLPPEQARENFALLCTSVHSWEFLQNQPDSFRRAKMDRTTNGWTGSWIVP